MVTPGLCAYCGRLARRTCRICGQAICDDHAAPTSPEVCTGCARGQTLRPGGTDRVHR